MGGRREGDDTDKTVVLKRVVIVIVNVVMMMREGKSCLKEKEREEVWIRERREYTERERGD